MPSTTVSSTSAPKPSLPPKDNPSEPSPRATHPNLPKGKEQVSLDIAISPHLSSPVGEGQIPL